MDIIEGPNVNFRSDSIEQYFLTGSAGNAVRWEIPEYIPENWRRVEKKKKSENRFVNI